MDQNLYQKIGVTIGQLAQDFLTRNVGDRIPSVSEYQEKFHVSRGTIQNALAYIKESQGISLKAHGHMGTYIEGIDYVRLQNCCIREEILGIMPLPYSVTYEGFATAVYETMKGLNFNMAYSRGAVGRIRLVESGTYQFAVCSQYAAEQAMREGSKVEIVMNFGAGSFLSRHVLMLRDTDGTGIVDGMRVGYDSTSLDQSKITERIIRDKKVELVEIKTQNIISGLKAGTIPECHQRILLRLCNFSTFILFCVAAEPQWFLLYSALNFQNHIVTDQRHTFIHQGILHAQLRLYHMIQMDIR